jgi:hypothetical protein
MKGKIIQAKKKLIKKKKEEQKPSAHFFPCPTSPSRMMMDVKQR